jgi:hypothetical protein
MYDWFKRLLRPAATEHTPAPLPDRRQTAGPPLELRVSLITHAPIIEAAGNQPLFRLLGWHDPAALVDQYIADLQQASGGYVRYRIVERHEVDAYPAKIDGFRYSDRSYLDCVQRRGPCHQPDTVDYPRLLAEFDMVGKINRNEIDEVWLMAFPYAGYYESMMAGPGAFWCNAPPLELPEARRRFVVMGFNYERDVGCMLENFGHRVESIMAHVYRRHRGEANLWQRFTRFDRDQPGLAECGNVHFAPSSQRDYDWGNRRVVVSRADAWYNFPDLSALPRPMSCREWGDGDMRAHHLWWLDHLPRVAGETDGIHNNWWYYILQPQAVD